ncbi:MAG: hypothetical protein DA330_01300 [Nitrososphaera sp.]|nr:hypothetical protein [Nitrososphaera sp.]
MMHIRSQLIMSFVLIALIPLSMLTAVLTYFILQLQDQISNLYTGAVEITAKLTQGSDNLIHMRSITVKHILATTAEEKQKIEEQVQSDETGFLRTLLDYKKITDFPLQIPILQGRNLESMIPYENNLLADVHSDFREFLAEKDKTLSLSNEGRNEEAIAQWAGPASDRLDKLRSDYTKLVDLNIDLARIMYEESQSVTQRAFTMGLLTAAGSAGAAGAVAIFFSRKLTPPLEEVERNARKEIEKFIAEAKSVAKPPAAEHNDSAAATEKISTDLDIGPVILIQSTGYHHGSPDEAKSQSAMVLDDILEKSFQQEAGNKLVIMTRKGSNLYYKARKSKALIYVLSSSIQNPIETSEDGLLIISVNQTSLILEAIKRTLQENPSATIILDNATELVHRLGFEKVFPLIQNISDLASSFPQSRVVILINKHAHEVRIVEALASIVNIFVE